jgi:hypothetical protein
MAIEDLRQSPMMSHMLDEGEDVGHYGRLIFVMIGRQFAGNDELVELLTKDHDADEECDPTLARACTTRGSRWDRACRGW